MLELFIEARVLSKIKKLNNVICYVQKQKTRADIILIARVSNLTSCYLHPYSLVMSNMSKPFHPTAVLPFWSS